MRAGRLQSYGTVAIIGVGLIGGSVGLALRARSAARWVIGIGRDESRLAEAKRRGAIDAATTDLARGIVEAEVTVVCTPVTRIAADVLQAAECGPVGMLVTDAGSTKLKIVEEVERNARARSAFVGAHPIAGSELKGVAHAQPELFENRVCVLTPTGQTPHDHLERARRFWSDLGCRIIEMDAEEHDKALALTSHLPHAVAAALAGSIPGELLPLAAGAYRDGTRVAGSDSALWAGIFCENRLPVLGALETFSDRLDAFRKALDAADEDELRAWWESARCRRGLFDEIEPFPRAGTVSVPGEF
jgi:prephenate dehydrogenase